MNRTNVSLTSRDQSKLLRRVPSSAYKRGTAPAVMAVGSLRQKTFKETIAVDKSRRSMLSVALPIGATALALGTAKSARAANITQSLTTAINNFLPGVGGFV